MLHKVMWQQLGVPCIHAVAVIQQRQILSDPLFYTETYFHPSALTATKIALFTNKLTGIFPSDSDVDERKILTDYLPLHPTIVLKKGEVISKKRFTSIGEAPSSSSITTTACKKGARKPCVHCGKLIKGPHTNFRACQLYKAKMTLQSIV